MHTANIVAATMENAMMMDIRLLERLEMMELEDVRRVDVVRRRRVRRVDRVRRLVRRVDRRVSRVRVDRHRAASLERTVYLERDSTVGEIRPVSSVLLESSRQ
jgi:hypothetical protein